MYNKLKHVAEQHHSSLNSEAIVCLKEMLFSKRTSPKDRLTNIQALRSKIEPNIVTTQGIEQAINEGRP